MSLKYDAASPQTDHIGLTKLEPIREFDSGKMVTYSRISSISLEEEGQNVHHKCKLSFPSGIEGQQHHQSKARPNQATLTGRTAEKE